VNSKLCVHLSGADGSVRMFDLRHLEHSTIIYEDPQHQPLLRLAWNKQDPNYLATMAMDALEVGFNDISPEVVYSKVFFYIYGVMLQHTETDTIVLHNRTQSTHIYKRNVYYAIHLHADSQLSVNTVVCLIFSCYIF